MLMMMRLSIELHQSKHSIVRKIFMNFVNYFEGITSLHHICTRIRLQYERLSLSLSVSS